MVASLFEATIHHHDVVRHLNGTSGPSPLSLTATQHGLDRLAERITGHAFPGAFTDDRSVLIATGRAEVTVSEANELVFGSGQLPLFT